MNASSSAPITAAQLSWQVAVACAVAAIATAYSSQPARSQESPIITAAPSSSPLAPQYYQDYRASVVPTDPAARPPAQLAQSDPPQIAPPPPPPQLPPPLLSSPTPVSPQAAPAPPNSLPPASSPGSLSEPIWVMPTTAPTAPTQKVTVPTLEPPAPPPVSRPLTNGKVSPTDLVVTATEVQILGVTPDLQDYALRAIQTKPGGTTSSSQLQNDVAILLNSGLFEVASVTTRPNSQGVSVTFFATPTIVRALSLPNARALSISTANMIFRDQFGKPVSLVAFNESVKQINDWYLKNGYTLGRVITVQPNRQGVVVIEVAEGLVGNVKVRFVNREGKAVDEQGKPIAYRTQDAFVRRQIKLEPGQPFQVGVARQDLQRLNQLGIFDAANITFEGDARQTDVVYNLVERPPRDLRFGGGYNDSLGLYGTIGVQDNNFGGLGQKLGGTVLVGTKDVQFDGRFVSPYRDTEPNVPGYNANVFRNQGLSTVFDDKVDLPNGDRVRERRYGIGIGLEKPLGDGWNGQLGFNYTNVSLRDSRGNVFAQDELGNPLSLSGTGIDDLFSFTFTALKDLRDNPLNPGNGSFLSFNTEQYLPIGRGNVFGTKLQASYSQYLPIKWITAAQKTPPSSTESQPEVLALNLQGGTYVGDLPPYNAFVLGGSNSVRGWDTAEIAASRSYIQATAEYRFPIYKFIGGAAFVDFASDLGTSDEVPGQPGVVRDRPGTGLGGGVGVRVNSPFGIIRGDLGVSNRGDVRFQFGFGQRF